MRAAIAIVLLSGCGRVAFDARDDAGDARMQDTAADAFTPCMTFGSFGTATAMTALNSPASETSPSLTNDGLAIYFSSFSDGDQDVYVATRTAIGQPWSAPAKIAELEQAGSEEGNVEISGDELELYYGETEVFWSQRASRSDSWPPVQLLITDSVPFTNPQGPELSRDGLTLYFAALTASTAGDIFFTTRADATAPFIGSQTLSALNTVDSEGFISLSASGVEMFYTSYSGGVNVYRATRPDTSTHATWSSSGVVTDIDSSAGQEDAELSADGTELYFLSERSGGMGLYDIWLATRACLD